MRQLDDIFAVLAGEAGISLTPVAARGASLILGRLDTSRAGVSFRLTVRLLDEAIARQSRQVTAAGQVEAATDTKNGLHLSKPTT